MPQNVEPPPLQSILHATDFSEESEQAFAHALAIALVTQSSFTILNAGADPSAEAGWQRFPAVRTTLERWGLLEPGSPRSAVFERLKIDVSKVGIRRRSALAGILDYVEHNPVDLIVMGTRGGEGMPRWIRPSVAEPMARRSQTKTLVVPKGGRGFVSPEDGTLALRRILVPVVADPDPRAALAYAARAALALGDERVEIEVSHVGDPDGMPAFEPLGDPRLVWRRSTRQGALIDEIIAGAEELPADLIVIPTRGIDELGELLTGSKTEQVLRRAPCAVLAVPTP
jgi:nucleotide-binding universal stress UspA family protein